MISELREVKKFLGAKFGIGENIPDGIYAIPTQTSRGKAFMHIEFKKGDIHGNENYHLFWDEKLTISWYDHRKPLFTRESKYSKLYRKLSEIN